MNQPNLSSFIWSVADLLRGDYKHSEYGRVILPFTVSRRLDCVLEPTKEAALAEKEKREAAGLNPDHFLLKASGHPQTYWTHSRRTTLRRNRSVVLASVDARRSGRPSQAR